MRKFLFPLGVMLLFAGCFDHVRLNPKIFKPTGESYSVQCGKNFDLCLERAEYHCGPKGYKIRSKNRTKEGYRLQVECRR